MKTLLETVSRQISDSLHVPRVAVLLDSSESFRPAYSLGYNPAPSVELKPEGTAVQVLKETRQPSRVYLDDENSWTQRTPEEEREILRILDSQLLLPLALKDRLLGIISLGPKLSEEPYSADDLRLLHAVASQTGLALENARLTESIKVEVARRERINRELEIAREVQQRLFPQHLPVVEGLDLAAYCRPQQGVGGDYYDFLRLEDGGCLGIAIGDVSGKGISAALTMATLQASLRGRTISQSESLAEMLGLINKLVYDASASNRYATFFYAQYYPKTRLLRYVNAGHNAPIVCRGNGVPMALRPTKGDEDGGVPAPNRDHEGADFLPDVFNGDDHRILRLEEGGTVLGLFPDWVYNEGSVQLEPGDTLVAFTDGISEAMNDREEEWDEESLIAAICESHSRTAADTIVHILDRVDAFTGGARQHDDMTLVVVRVQ
jgi:sigma-B regulation protein RsbU (phosphoserine phosphatase)